MSLILALLGLGIVIFAHELGHFLGARLGGMRVKQFALGFGWRLFGLRRRGTDYRVNAIPFGGYVMVDGVEDEEAEAERNDPRKMQNRPVWARAVFALSGPLFNLVLAGVLLSAAVSMQGLPAGRRVEVGTVQAGSPAARAGLRTGDILLTVNGEEAVSAATVSGHVGKAVGAVVFRVQRGGEIRRIVAYPHDGRVGMMLQERVLYRRDRLTPVAVAGYTVETLTRMSLSVAEAFAMLVTGRAGVRDLTGPVGMVSQAAATAATGPANLLLLLAFISVNLGLFNLIPIPALDGGRLVLLALEKAGIRLSQTRQAAIQVAGFAVIFILIIVVSVFDVARMVR